MIKIEDKYPAGNSKRKIWQLCGIFVKKESQILPRKTHYLI